MRRVLLLGHLIILIEPFVVSIPSGFVKYNCITTVSLELLPPSGTFNCLAKHFCFVSFHQSSSCLTSLWTNTPTESNSNLSMFHLKRWNTYSASALHKFPGYGTTFAINLTQLPQEGEEVTICTITNTGQSFSIFRKRKKCGMVLRPINLYMWRKKRLPAVSSSYAERNKSDFLCCLSHLTMCCSGSDWCFLSSEDS